MDSGSASNSCHGPYLLALVALALELCCVIIQVEKSDLNILVNALLVSTGGFAFSQLGSSNSMRLKT